MERHLQNVATILTEVSDLYRLVKVVTDTEVWSELKDYTNVIGVPPTDDCRLFSGHGVVGDQ